MKQDEKKLLYDYATFTIGDANLVKAICNAYNREDQCLSFRDLAKAALSRKGLPADLRARFKKLK